MYNSNPRNNYHHRYGGNYHGIKAGRTVNKLNPNLLIKKAKKTGLENEPVISGMRFSDYHFVDNLKKNISAHGYTNPTPIQVKAIPLILAGRDVIGIANTGTGKTAAFLTTLVNKCYLDRYQKVLIVVPTRELAMQIEDEFDAFSKNMGISAVLAVGGTSIGRQIYGLRHNPHFVIGTPGRLKDLIGRRELNLGYFQNIVLDEVDRMVDIGFINDIKYIISFLSKVRQSLFFSATVGGKTREVLQSFVTNPVTVSVKDQDAAENIEQDIIKVADKSSKINVLTRLLTQKGFDKVLVFGRTKWGMEKLSRALVGRGFRAAAIHGNKSQNQRQRALMEFKNDDLQVLIATDIASRGLDIEDVTHVINYDMPASMDDYIHRIGRTGRAGKRGVALTFVE